MKKVYRKRLVRALLVLIPVLVITGVLLYIKLSGFRTALEQLVDAESSGEYSLNIEKSSIGILDLSFTFNDLTVRRNSSSNERGIDAVHVPYLRISFGSIASMLMVKRFDIESCIIHEPVIEINASAKRDDSVKESITLSQQIVQLYPAVEALLGRFDIKSLKIIRASVGMNKKPSSSLKLNLIDLFVEEWNIQNLTDESQLQLKVGGQNLDFGKAALDFSGIEFDFQKHHLLFSDFHFLSQDTVSDSRIVISGKSLVLQQLDYKDLYENRRYSIRKAQIDNPNVTVHFKLKKRDTTKVHDRTMLTRILKHAIGECSVDSTIIRDARVHIVAQQGSDSVRIDLPTVNFRLQDFKVTQDSSNFSFGDMEIDLNRTAIELKKDMSLHCDRIFFDRFQDLTLTNVVLFDSLRREPIVTCDKFRLNYFNLLNYIFYKDISANTISLENAQIQLTPDAGQRAAGGRKNQAINNVAIHNVSLKNVTIHYQDAERRLSVDNLTMFMYNLRGDRLGNFQYTIQNIYLKRASHASTKPGALHSQVRDLSFDGRSLNVKEVSVRRDSLYVQIKDFIAEKAGDDPIQKNYRHWKIAQVGSVKLTGKLPKAGIEPRDAWQGDDVNVKQLKVSHLHISLRGKETQFTSNASNFVVRNLAVTTDRVEHGDITGDVSDIAVLSSSVKANAAKVRVEYPSFVHATEVVIQDRRRMIKTPFVTVNDITKNGHEWLLKSIKTKGVAIIEEEAQLLHADSVLLTDTKLAPGSSPIFGQLEVFRPEIWLSEISSKEIAGNNNSFRLPEQITIRPGTLRLRNNKQIAFGRIQHSASTRKTTCAFIQGKTDKMHLKLTGLSIKPGLLTIDSVRTWPNDEWFQVQGWEDDLIEAELYGVHVNNLSLESLSQARSIKNADVSVHDFILNVKRDKRRIDPPEKEKPAALSGLLKLPPEISINSIQVLDGTIRYTETSEKTGADGIVLLEDVSATAEFDTTLYNWPKHVKAKGMLYNKGLVDLHYTAIDSSAFDLRVVVRDFDLTHLNKVVVPLQSLNIKSGNLKNYELVVTADSEKATGQATITYKDLHLVIFKRTEPEKKTLGSGLLTLLADGIILRHSKRNAVAPVEQPRIKHKSIFNYWIKTAVYGAMNAVRKGKTPKTRRRS